MGPVPTVTGISPKEGPPGTRVTIRGENLGTSANDLIGLTICGADCTLSAEWKSNSKIIARTGPGKSKGEVIVTTLSGGMGSCTVQFRGYMESIGPLKESAVWVDEPFLVNFIGGRKLAAMQTQVHSDNPLGLSDEANEGTKQQHSDDDLQDMFPDGSGNFLSESFVPAWFLLANHNSATMNDLKAGLNCLKRKVNSQKEGELSFLKANVGYIMDQTEALSGLGKAVVELKTAEEKSDPNCYFTERMEEAILYCKCEADMLFRDVLETKDKADATRNALNVLQRFRFLFHLPCNIERNINQGDYDAIINDYARAKSLFGNTEVEIFKKVYREVEQHIANTRERLTLRLKDLPLGVDEQKKLIKYLVQLDTGGDPAWDSITYNHSYIAEAMKDTLAMHLPMDQPSPDVSGGAVATKNNKLLPSLPLGVGAERKRSIGGSSGSNSDPWQVKPPCRVAFVEQLSRVFVDNMTELLRLAQSYFRAEFRKEGAAIKINSGQDVFKQGLVKRLVAENVQLFCNMSRSAVLPDSLGRASADQREAYGAWLEQTREALDGWLPRCFRCLRIVYSQLVNTEMETDYFQTIQDMIFDLRVRSISVTLKSAIEDIGRLALRETWQVDVNDDTGGTTQLPVLYENIVVETLQWLKESVVQPEHSKEKDLFSQPLVEDSVVKLCQELLVSFVSTLNRLATKSFFAESDKGRTQAVAVEPARKLLIILNNANYTVQHVVARLNETYKKNGYPQSTIVFEHLLTAFETLDSTLFASYVELKSESIVGAIEETMYDNNFDWNSYHQPAGCSTYAKELLMNIIAVQAEVYAVGPVFVTRIVTRLIELVSKELARLFSNVTKFSAQGTVQATVDLTALQEAFKSYQTNAVKAAFEECTGYVPNLNSNQFNKCIDDHMTTFRTHMSLLLMCFQADAVCL